MLSTLGWVERALANRARWQEGQAGWGEGGTAQDKKPRENGSWEVGRTGSLGGKEAGDAARVWEKWPARNSRGRNGPRL